MRKTKLTKREIEICERLRRAREELGITQQACAQQIGIERSTLTNYEFGKTPVRYQIALRFCRQLIVSEEWLATGKTALMQAAAVKHGFDPGTDWTSLGSIFFRQCMDLLSEPICQRLPPGMLFSEAYDRHLASRFSELACQFFYTPRIVSGSGDNPELAANLINALVERWLKMLSNEALRLNKEPRDVQRQFVRALIEASSHIFRKFLGFTLDQKALEKLGWLKETLTYSDAVLGTLYVETKPESAPIAGGVTVTRARESQAVQKMV